MLQKVHENNYYNYNYDYDSDYNYDQPRINLLTVGFIKSLKFKKHIPKELIKLMCQYNLPYFVSYDHVLNALLNHKYSINIYFDEQKFNAIGVYSMHFPDKKKIMIRLSRIVSKICCCDEDDVISSRYYIIKNFSKKNIRPVSEDFTLNKEDIMFSNLPQETIQKMIKQRNEYVKKENILINTQKKLLV
jgi:hypothetical protein